MVLDDDYWPSWAPLDCKLDSMHRFYAHFGYGPCKDGSLEPGKRKIALYCFTHTKGFRVVNHVARQLDDGWWSSKLGTMIDVEHETLQSLQPTYGLELFFVVGPRIRGAEPGPREP